MMSNRYKVFTKEFDKEINGSDLVAPALPPDQAVLADLEARLAVKTLPAIAGSEHLSDATATLLIDHSGSMGGNSALIAICLAEIICHYWNIHNVPHDVLGFTTSSWKGGHSREKWVAAGKPVNPGRLCDLLHIVYRSADQPPGEAPKALRAILDFSLLRENVDGEAIQWAAARLALRRQARKVLLVISDGAPMDDSTAAANSGYYLENHLREVLGLLSSDATYRVAAIGIQHDTSKFYQESLDVFQVGAHFCTETVNLQALESAVLPFVMNLTSGGPKSPCMRIATLGEPVVTTPVSPYRETTIPAPPFQAFASKPQDRLLLPEMVVVPAGRFKMGLSPEEAGRISEWWCENAVPQREIAFATPFAVGRYAVTFSEWEQAQLHPEWASPTGIAPRIPHDEYWGRGRRPVIHVTWHDAKAYAHWLSRITGDSYRLLTEAEWEYCCRAGRSTPFWWGSTPEKELANCGFYGKGHQDQRTAPVDSIRPNPWGLYQMQGNTWEWCEDEWHNSFSGDPPHDGSAWGGGSANNRAIRGGSWAYSLLHAAARSSYPSDGQNEEIGFRIAKTLAPIQSN